MDHIALRKVVEASNENDRVADTASCLIQMNFALLR
jgi:hypothetical protein